MNDQPGLYFVGDNMKKRIIGIDLLRILSMYMIMTLHTMSNGGTTLSPSKYSTYTNGYVPHFS